MMVAIYSSERRACVRLLSSRAQEADLGSLTYMLEVAAMEAEYQLTGVFLPPKIRN
jgi:hypothetical protein